MPLTGLGTALLGLTMFVLVADAESRSTPSAMACEPAPAVRDTEGSVDLSVSETDGASIGPDRRALVAPEAISAMGGASPNASFEERYEGWDAEALSSRYEELVAQFVEELERAVEPRFGSGNYRLYLRGDVRPPHDRIHAVRSRVDGIYQEVVLEPAEAPEVYDLQAEAAWLHDLLGRVDES